MTVFFLWFLPRWWWEWSRCVKRLRVAVIQFRKLVLMWTQVLFSLWPLLWRCVCVCVCVGDLATAVHLSTQHIGNANTLCQVCVWPRPSLHLHQPLSPCSDQALLFCSTQVALSPLALAWEVGGNSSHGQVGTPSQKGICMYCIWLMIVMMFVVCVCVL